MSALDSSPSSNGRAPEGWSSSWTHLHVKRRSSGYCRVTFDHPPINAINAMTVLELAELVALVEQDPDLRVIVFDSANPDSYLAHYDTDRGTDAWPELLARLSRAPVISIASIRGRVRGAGSEFVLACDLRFASRENSSILLVADELDGPRAEQYGYVNRVIADEQLDDEVDQLASRLGRSDHDAIAGIKSCLDEVTRRPPGSSSQR